MKESVILPSLNTVNTHSELKIEVYELPHTKNTPYVVDDSCFIPTSEAIKQLGANSGAATDLKQFYDFPDGNDTGMSVPITRTKSVKDIAEISSHIMDKVNDTADKVSEARNAAKKKAAFEKSLNNIKAAGNTSSNATE